MILSAALMLRHSFQLEDEARLIEETVESVLNAGFHTADLNLKSGHKVGTLEMTQLIIDSIKTRSAANCIMSCYA
jgi:3-isopropylmalate dehydrogenase